MTCPECGSDRIRREGRCPTCRVCGFNGCYGGPV